MTKEQFILVAKQIAKKSTTTPAPSMWLRLEIDTDGRKFRITNQMYHGAKFNDTANIANPKGINFCSAFAPQLTKTTGGSISLYVQGTNGVGQTDWYPIPMNITWDDLYYVCKAVSDYNKAMEEYETKKDTFGHPEFQHWFTTEYTEGYIQAGIKSENLALDFRLSIDQTTGKKSLTVTTQKYHWGNFNPYTSHTDFRASNGIVLTSITHPEWNPSNRMVLYLRGTDTDRDDISLDVSDMSFSELREIYMAVFEYNVAVFKYEQKKAEAEKPNVKDEFIKWFRTIYAKLPHTSYLDVHLEMVIDWEDGKTLLTIRKQTYRGWKLNPMIAEPCGAEFEASNGVKLYSASFPEWRPKDVRKRLYVRGANRDRDNEIIDVTDMTLEELKKVFMAVYEYNEAMRKYEQKKATPVLSEKELFVKWLEKDLNESRPYEDDPALGINLDLNASTLRIKLQKYRREGFNPMDGGQDAFKASNGFRLASGVYPAWFRCDRNVLFVQGSDKTCDGRVVDIKDMPYETLKTLLIAVREYNTKVYEHEQSVLKTYNELLAKEEFLRWYENTYRAKNRNAIYGDDPALRLDIDLDTSTLFIKTQKYQELKFNPVTTGDPEMFKATNGFSLYSIAYPHWNADDPSRHNDLYLQGATDRTTEKVNIKGMPYETIKKMFEAVHEYNEMIYRHENPLHMHIDYGTGDVTTITPEDFKKKQFIEWFHEFRDAPLPFPRRAGALGTRFNPYKMTLEIAVQRYGKPGSAFNPMTGKNYFEASNGCSLWSVQHPEMGNKMFYVRGEQTARDNDVLDLSDKSYDQIKNILEAIREYNLKVYEFEQGEAKGEIIGNPDHLQISMTDKTIKVLSLKHKGDSFSSPHTSKFFSSGVVFSASKEILPGIYLDDMRVGVNFREGDTYDILKWSIGNRNNFKNAVATYNEWREDVSKGVRLNRWNISYILMGIE